MANFPKNKLEKWKENKENIQTTNMVTVYVPYYIAVVEHKGSVLQ